MLKAILHGKAGRIEHDGQTSVRWASLFKDLEDLLTSTVFERFAYLSDDLQAHLLQHWFQAHSGEVPQCFGEFKSISYWSRFTHEHDEDSNQVEPDLIIHFDNCNILVEVKPPAGGDQYFEQWHKEIESFLQSEGDSPKDLYFLAIGRIDLINTKLWADELLPKFEQRLKGVASLKWKTVTAHLVALMSDNSDASAPVMSKQDRRIIQDILDGLSLYGEQASPFKWSALMNAKKFKKLSLNHTQLSSESILSNCRISEPFSSENLLKNSLYPLDLQHFQSSLKE
ncbi:hypothetical protein AB4304_03570 [Vibrio breoganii]|uniref:hypothetical protein n=1 Tax=Vibrio breoganii TaxID=553239 RepID=UPI000C85ADD4|nr:hypothetical protein [Vibrio breoganii]PMK47719.1 hypothetical protein BCU00_05110 [Vibrio breoganii]TKG23310.1 hypothetical protein FCV84_00190 [Vibrio breoganii]